MGRRPRSVAPWDEQSHRSFEAHQSVTSLGNQEDMLKGMNKSPPI